jgi:TRAP-type mannitol/chloroaromatic compound transport system permease small subunit
MDETDRGGAASGPPKSLFDGMTKGLGRLGTGLILLVMLLVNADVIGRYFFDRPIAGVAELVSLSIVAIVFLQLPHTLRHERFIRSDVLIGPLMVRRPRLGFALQAIHHLFAAMLCGLIFWYVVPQFIEAWEAGEYVGTLGVFQAPKWPVELIIVIGAGLTAIQSLLHLVRDIAVARGTRPPPAHRAATEGDVA